MTTITRVTAFLLVVSASMASLPATRPVCASPAAVAEPLDTLRARARRLDVLLGRMEPFGFRGAVAVIDRGAVLLAKGYGFADSASHVAIDGHTVFDVGSMSKTFTAAVVLRLVDAGRLSLDDSLARFFPEAPPDKRAITLRQILSHTSGLPVFHDREGDFEVMSRDTAVGRILQAPLGEDRGAFSYSNSGYTLLAAIAEQVTGTRFAALLQREVFAPAGMRHAGLYSDARWGEPRHVAHGFIGLNDAGSPATWAPGHELWALLGNGGVTASLADLIAWDRALQRRAMLSPRAYEAFMHSEVEVGPDVGYALGWYLRDEPIRGRSYGHTGANDFGFASAYQHYVASGLTVILLINHQLEADVNVSVYRDHVLGTIEHAMFDDLVTLPPDVRPLGTNELEPLLGRWRFDDGSSIDAERWPGAVRLVSDGPLAAKLLAGLDSTGCATADSLVTSASRIMDGMIHDDFGPLAAMIRDPQRLAGERGFFEKKLEGLRARGAIRGFSIVSATPAWWSDDQRFATVIRIRSDADSMCFRMHWDGGRVAQFGGNAIQRGPSALVMRDRAGRLVGYGPMTGGVTAITPLGSPGKDRLRLATSGTAAEAIRVRP